MEKFTLFHLFVNFVQDEENSAVFFIDHNFIPTFLTSTPSLKSRCRGYIFVLTSALESQIKRDGTSYDCLEL